MQARARALFLSLSLSLFTHRTSELHTHTHTHTRPWGGLHPSGRSSAAPSPQLSFRAPVCERMYIIMYTPAHTLLPDA